ncbi:CLUMA_CG005613, isoform A [Clunio marinus]|uniref:CLUMA_CG005613, isoform A n=1 Tax=Clunio marinus TaxID=568069 RepID=A0A1J1I0Y6_9DIPT|nr:CLUMA_CG005613, isoform A [Clunio marinus]
MNYKTPVKSATLGEERKVIKLAIIYYQSCDDIVGKWRPVTSLPHLLTIESPAVAVKRSTHNVQSEKSDSEKNGNHLGQNETNELKLIKGRTADE